MTETQKAVAANNGSPPNFLLSHDYTGKVPGNQGSGILDREEIKVANEEFLRAIFGENAPFAHVCSFPDDPSNISTARRFNCWGGGYAKDTTINPNDNTYYTVSIFNPDDEGRARRRKALFMAAYIVPLDDVIEKLPLEQVNKLPKPSYILETSPGSLQYGYILDVPCNNRHLIDNLHDGLIANGIAPNSTDPGQKSVTRYIRLPQGTNTKAKRVAANGGVAPACRLLEWNPERRVSLEALAAPFGVDLTAERREGRVDGAASVDDHPLLDVPDIIVVKSVRSDGRYDITCPWVDEHTGGADDGAAAFTNNDGSIGFRCHHGSCESRTTIDLLDFIEEYKPGFLKQLEHFKVLRSFNKVEDVIVTKPISSIDPVMKSLISEPVEPKTLATVAGLAGGNEPLPLMRVLPEAASFPLDAFPPVLQKMAEKIIETIQPPPALAGQSVLAAASLAAQPHADISIDGRCSPLSCYFVTVGESGERKSATDSEVLRPHRKHERALFDLEQSAEFEYMASLEAWKRSREKAVKCKEDVKQAVLALGPEPLPPLGGQFITEEPTIEGIHKLLQYGQPSVGIFSAEGGRFLGGHAMSKDNQLKTATGLSSAWDGASMTRTRSGDGNSTLCGRRVALHLMLQPNIAADLFSNALLVGQGLTSRCLVAYPGSTIGNRPYRAVDLSNSPEARAYFAVMMNLLEMQKPIAEGQRNELKPRQLILSSEAKNEWVGFHDDIEQKMQAGGELADIRGFAAKAAEHAARLAGVLTLVENPTATSVSHQMIQSGIKLSRFYIGEALRLFHSANEDQDLVMAEKCLEWIIGYGGQFSLPCLYQKGPSRVRSKEKAKEMVVILLGHNRLRPITGGAVIDGKNRRTAWQVLT